MPFGDDAVIVAVTSGDGVSISVTATGMTGLTVYRRQSGRPDVIVRGAKETATIGPGLWAGGDFEAPQGYPLSYLASITDGVDTATAGPVSMTGGVVDFGGDFFFPVGQPTFGMVINIEAGGLGQITREVVRDVRPVLNRASPVAVSFGRRFWNAELSLLTLSNSERQQFIRLIEFPVIVFLARPDYGVDDPVYLSLGSVTEERTSPFGAETSRRWLVEVDVVDRPPPDFPYIAVGTTWTEIDAAHASWTAVNSAFVDWYEVAGYPS